VNSVIVAVHNITHANLHKENVKDRMTNVPLTHNTLNNNAHLNKSRNQ